MANVVIFNHSNSILPEDQTKIMVDVIGYIGGGLTACIMIPQVYKAYKTKKTRHISKSFLIIQLFATIFNAIYALLENLLPLIVTLPLIGLQSVLIIIAKCLYDKNEDEIVNKGNIENIG